MTLSRQRTFYIASFEQTGMLRSLDDLRGISRIDSGNMLGAVNRFPDFLADFPSLEGVRVDSSGGFESLVLAGMGGSGSAADVLFDWLGPKVRVPFIVMRDSVLPRFVGRGTLLIAFSYSGETGETLSVFRKAARRGCTLAGVGSGGKLAGLCGRSRVPFVEVPRGVVPRAALGPLIGAGAVLLEKFGIVKGVRARLQEAGRELGLLRGLFRAEVPSSRNKAKRISMKLRDTLPVVYCLQRMSSVARRAKNQFAENSKLVAKYDLLPEAGHNEVVAWQSRNARAVPVLIRDMAESREEQVIIEAFEATLMRIGARKPLEVRGRAASDLGRLLGPLFLLDYVSVYLACLMGVDPTPTEGIRQYRRLFSQMKRG